MKRRHQLKHPRRCCVKLHGVWYVSVAKKMIVFACHRKNRNTFHLKFWLTYKGVYQMRLSPRPYTDMNVSSDRSPLDVPKATPYPAIHQQIAPNDASPMFLMRMFFVFLMETDPTCKGRPSKRGDRSRCQYCCSYKLAENRVYHRKLLTNVSVHRECSSDRAG